MKRYLILACFLLIPFSAQAGEPRYVPIKITPVFDTPRYDYTQDLSGIQRLSSDPNHSIREKLTMGLTRYKPALEFRIASKGWQNNQTGVSCMYLDHVDVTFGYKDVVVYIANEIPQNSCGFQRILEHEQKHIAVNWNLLRELLPRMQTTLQDYLNQFGTMCVSNKQEVIDQINETFRSMLNKWGDELKRENHDRQVVVDTPEEYESISRDCDGQLAVIAGRYFKTHPGQ